MLFLSVKCLRYGAFILYIVFPFLPFLALLCSFLFYTNVFFVLLWQIWWKYYLFWDCNMSRNKNCIFREIFLEQQLESKGTFCFKNFYIYTKRVSGVRMRINHISRCYISCISCKLLDSSHRGKTFVLSFFIMSTVSLGVYIFFQSFWGAG